MSKIAFLVPNSVITSTGWTLVAGGSVLAAITPGDPLEHDDNSTYVNIGSGGAGNRLTVDLGSKPNDIATVVSFGVAHRIRTEGSDAHFYHSVWLNAVELDSALQNHAVVLGVPGGVWTDHVYYFTRPDGEAWTASDIADSSLQISVRLNDFHGPSTGTLKFDVTSAWVILEYEPIRDIGSLRETVSRSLWAGFRPLPDLKVTVPLHVGLDVEPLDAMHLSHPAIPHSEQDGLLTLPWQRGHFYVASRRLEADARRVSLRLRDRRWLSCLYQDIAWTSIWSAAAAAWGDGVPRFSKGSTRTFTRASDAWIDDPSDDTVRNIEDDIEKNGSGGLLIEGARTNHLVRSSFVSGTTGLTLSGTGSNGSAIAVDTSDLLFEDTVTPNSLKITSGSPIHAADLYVQWPATAALADANHRLAIDYKNGSAAAPLSFALQRGSDSNWLDNSDGSWGAALTWNDLTGSATRARFYSISFDPGSATTMTLRIGVPTATGTAGQIDHVYHVQLEEGTYNTSRIVTDAATVARAVDALVTTNDLGARVWNAARGAFSFQLVPGWDAADVSGLEKTCFYLQHDASNYERIYYDGTNQLLVAERMVQGVTYQATASLVAVRGTVYDCVYRWTGEDGELDLTPFTLSLFVDGTKGTDVVANNPPAFIAEFEDNLLDSSANENHLTVDTGSAAYTTGQYGRAFDTNNSTVKLVTSESKAVHDVGAAEDLTLHFRINVQAAPAAGRFIFRKGAALAANPGWAAILLATRRVGLRISDGTDTESILQSTTALSTSTWYSVVMVMERGAGANGERRVYVNGSLEATDTDISAIDSLSNSEAMNLFDSGGAIDVHLDQVGMVKRAWTTEEITRFHNSGAGIRVPIDAPPTEADDTDLEYGATSAANYLDGQIRMIHSFQYVPFDAECQRFPPR